MALWQAVQLSLGEEIILYFIRIKWNSIVLWRDPILGLLTIGKSQGSYTFSPSASNKWKGINKTQLSLWLGDSAEAFTLIGRKTFATCMTNIQEWVIYFFSWEFSVYPRQDSRSVARCERDGMEETDKQTNRQTNKLYACRHTGRQWPLHKTYSCFHFKQKFLLI